MSAIAKKILYKYYKKKACGLDVPQTRMHFDSQVLDPIYAWIRNSDWEDDNDLNKDLAKFVSLNLKRMEIVDFLRKDYPMYAWSLRSLARRMQYFGIQFTDYDVEVNDVEAAVEKEISGPGKLLGYRAMHKKKYERYTV